MPRPTLTELQDLASRFEAHHGPGGSGATYWLIQAIIDIEYLGGNSDSPDLTRADIFRAVHSLEEDRIAQRGIAVRDRSDEGLTVDTLVAEA